MAAVDANVDAAPAGLSFEYGGCERVLIVAQIFEAAVALRGVVGGLGR